MSRLNIKSWSRNTWSWILVFATLLTAIFSLASFEAGHHNPEIRFLIGVSVGLLTFAGWCRNNFRHTMRSPYRRVIILVGLLVSGVLCAIFPVLIAILLILCVLGLFLGAY